MARGLIDLNHVRRKIPSLSLIRPIEEYLSKHAEAVPPNEFFDYEYYRSQTGLENVRNPLFHYVEFGEVNGYRPNVNFDPVYYLANNADLKNLKGSAFEHFVKFGFWEGRAPRAFDPRVNDIIDLAWMRENARPGDIPAGAHNGLNYYLFSSPAKSPCREFDPEFYQKQLGPRNPKISLLEDYLAEGEKENVWPSINFDPYFYREMHLQSARDESPLHHFCTVGRSEHLPTTTSPELWRLVTGENPSVEDSPMVAATAYVQGGWRTSNPNSFFDRDYYLRQYSGSIPQNINPFSHYLIYGEQAGVQPSKKFDPSWYYEANPDVKAAKLSALGHFLLYGRSEGRRPIAEPALKSWAEISEAMRTCGCSPLPRSCSIELPAQSVNEETAIHARSFDLTVDTETGTKFQKVSLSLLSNVIGVGGTRFLIHPNNHILHDEIQLLRGNHIRHEKFAGARRHGDKLRLEVGMRPAKNIDAGIHVMHEYDANYFHLIAETLPRIHLAQLSNIPRNVPFLTSGSLHPNLKLLLQLVNHEQRPIIPLEHGVLHHVSKLYYVGDCSQIVDAYDGGPFSRSSFIDTRGIANCIEPLVKVGSDSKYGPRILAIRNGRYRSLINQAELARALRQIGFQIVDCATMSIYEQIDAFRNAEIVVSPTGAQLSNIIWCKPATKVYVLASDHPSHQLYLWELLSRVSRAEVETILGPIVTADGEVGDVHSNYKVEVDSVVGKVVG